MEEKVTCITCENLKGCHLLINKQGELDTDKVIMTDSKKCPIWGSVGFDESTIRIGLFNNFGLGAIRAIHRLRNENLQDKEGAVDEHFDVKGILRPGMTKAEREEQLMYSTDNLGNFILVGEDRVPRRSLILRKYAINELKLPEDVVSFEPVKTLIRLILKAESEAGLLAKGPKKPREKPVEQPEPVIEPVVSVQPTEPVPYYYESSYEGYTVVGK
jgi:hypothetical protein